MNLVDDSWTKKQLYAECKRRGIAGCSGLAKDGLIQTLNQGALCARERASGPSGLQRVGRLKRCQSTCKNIGVLSVYVPGIG